MPGVIAGDRTSAIYQLIEEHNYSQAIGAISDLQVPDPLSVGMKPAGSCSTVLISEDS